MSEGSANTKKSWAKVLEMFQAGTSKARKRERVDDYWHWAPWWIGDCAKDADDVDDEDLDQNDIGGEDIDDDCDDEGCYEGEGHDDRHLYVQYGKGSWLPEEIRKGLDYALDIGLSGKEEGPDTREDIADWAGLTRDNSEWLDGLLDGTLIPTGWCTFCHRPILVRAETVLSEDELDAYREKLEMYLEGDDEFGDEDDFETEMYIETIHERLKRRDTLGGFEDEGYDDGYDG